MYCKFCGKGIDADSKFCSYCGAKQSVLNKPMVSDSSLLHETQESNPIDNGSFTTNSKSEEFKPLITENVLYRKESDATFTGVVILGVSVILFLSKPFEFDTIEAFNQFKSISLIISIIFRIIAIIWVTKITRRANKNTGLWGIFAFFLPSIALIFVGQIKIKVSNFNINPSLSNKENSKILGFKAAESYNKKDFASSMVYVEKAIELNPNNSHALELRDKIRLKISLRDIKNSQEQIVLRELTNGQIIKIVSNYYKSLDALVYINDSLAPDNTYHYKFNNEIITIVVDKGRINEINKS